MEQHGKVSETKSFKWKKSDTFYITPFIQPLSKGGTNNKNKYIMLDVRIVFTFWGGDWREACVGILGAGYILFFELGAVF